MPGASPVGNDSRARERLGREFEGLGHGRSLADAPDMLGLAVSLCLAQSATTLGAVPPMVSVDGDRYDVEGRKVREEPTVGFRFDVGIPDGAGASILVLPSQWFAVHVAALHNGAGAGVRVGGELIIPPFWRYFRFTLSGDLGSYSGGNASFIAGALPSELRGTVETALSHVSYQFASGQVGFELGTKGFSFVLRGGLSYVDGALGSPSGSIGDVGLTSSGVRIRGAFPSTRAGFLFCF